MFDRLLLGILFFFFFFDNNNKYDLDNLGVCYYLLFPRLNTMIERHATRIMRKKKKIVYILCSIFYIILYFIFYIIEGYNEDF